MSDLVKSLPGILTGGGGVGPIPEPSRAFQIFIKSLGNIHCKQDEEHFINKELKLQKQRLSQPQRSTYQMRENLVRLLYCHLMGYDVSFAYIHAVKLAQQGSLLEKRAGYLLTSVFLHKDHELIMLLVNTIQMDLKSSNTVNIVTALTASSVLLTSEMIPAVLPLVEDKLKHNKEIIRKKALICLHSFYMKLPEILSHLRIHFKNALGDRDPGVVWAALHFFHHLIKLAPAEYQDLRDPLLSILDQIVRRRLPAEFEYHGVPAPWMLILILKMLALLGHNQRETSIKIYPYLQMILQNTEPNHKIGLAVIHECLETILKIYPHPNLVEHAAKCVGRFLSSKSSNLQYMGLKSLSSVVQQNAAYALEHQAVVMSCLEHSDASIRLQTLDLLFNMSNIENVEAISERLLSHHQRAESQDIKNNITNKLLSLSQSFVNKRSWYIKMIINILNNCDTSEHENIVNEIISNIKAGKDSFLQESFDSLWPLITESPPAELLQVIAWVAGEYAPEDKHSSSEMCKTLCHVFCQTESTLGRFHILNALIKQTIHQSSEVSEELIMAMKESCDKKQTSALQLLRELHMLQMNIHTVNVTRLSSNSENELDYFLSFLDDYVADSLENGEVLPRISQWKNQDRISSKDSQSSGVLERLPYSSYDYPCLSTEQSMYKTPGGVTPHLGMPNEKEQSHDNELRLSGVKRVWGADGIIQENTNDEENSHCASSPAEESDDKLTVDGKAEDKSSSEQLTAALFSGISPQATNMQVITSTISSNDKK